jgi:uncharacterized membrane protein YeaQ/YmgE (transglycosylase-associated protein family)
MIGIGSVIIMLIVGAIAGWLAGKIVRGFEFGLIWNIVIGIVGAFFGVWLFRQLGVIFAGFLGSLVSATIGAVILLGIVRLIRHYFPDLVPHGDDDGSTIFKVLFWIHQVVLGLPSMIVGLDILLQGESRGIINGIGLLLAWIGGTLVWGLAALMYRRPFYDLPPSPRA